MGVGLRTALHSYGADATSVLRELTWLSPNGEPGMGRFRRRTGLAEQFEFSPIAMLEGLR